ncbi:MAG: XRE family transcriptional regulator [Lachnospiraceae bacterium]|nr:XRE family transcriptional regulator [Lachnospiraceae bacterium]
MSLGTNIRKRRYELRLSQQELADLLGYKNRSTIARIESGENDITQKKLQKIVAALDTTVEALLAGSSAAEGNPAIVVSPQAAANYSPSRNRSRVTAIILAGGKSVRNRQNIPNQFIQILGKPVLIYCLEAYQAHPAVDAIYVVCLKGWEQIVTAYAEQYRITKLQGLIPAASSGILSARNGLEYISQSAHAEDIVIFQESNRPLVTVETISKLLQATQEKGSAVISQPARDQVHFIARDGRAEYVERDDLLELQSPEAYQIKLIREAFKKASESGHPLNETCCTMLLYHMGFPINFIEGGVNNIKIIRQEDIAVAASLIRGEL